MNHSDVQMFVKNKQIQNFADAIGGSRVCSCLTPRSAPHRYQRKFLTYKHLPPPLRTHIIIQNFETLEQLLKNPSLCTPKNCIVRGRGAVVTIV